MITAVIAMLLLNKAKFRFHHFYKLIVQQRWSLVSESPLIEYLRWAPRTLVWIVAAPLILLLVWGEWGERTETTLSS